MAGSQFTPALPENSTGPLSDHPALASRPTLRRFGKSLAYQHGLKFLWQDAATKPLWVRRLVSASIGKNMGYAVYRSKAGYEASLLVPRTEITFEECGASENSR